MSPAGYRTALPRDVFNYLTPAVSWAALVIAYNVYNNILVVSF
jgi:hypothetical protein